MNSILTKTAKAYSAEITPQSPQLNHIGADGSSPFDRVERLSSDFNIVAENLATKDTPAGAFRRLLDSPPHKQNILDPQLNLVGFGGIGDQNTVVQLFGGSKVEKCSNGKTATKTSDTAPAPAPLAIFPTKPDISAWASNPNNNKTDNSSIKANSDTTVSGNVVINRVKQPLKQIIVDGGSSSVDITGRLQRRSIRLVR